MRDKIALVSCSGLSPLGLVVRAATVDLALEEDNIVAACITEYSAQPNQCSHILKDAPVSSFMFFQAFKLVGSSHCAVQNSGVLIPFQCLFCNFWVT